VGWIVTVCDVQARWQTRERFAAADHLRLGPVEAAAEACAASESGYAVLMSHHFERDREALRALLGTGAPYIGLLGPRRRADKMLADLHADGWRPRPVDLASALARVHAPVGLALGAETPAEIALSVVAEIQAVRAQAKGGFLRDKRGAIHAPEGQEGEEAEGAGEEAARADEARYAAAPAAWKEVAPSPGARFTPSSAEGRRPAGSAAPSVGRGSRE
jgi:xanthine/CO dehydrogenase XdhC/CoxF family maturation factor